MNQSKNPNSSPPKNVVVSSGQLPSKNMDSSGEADENFLDSDEMQIVGGTDNQQIDFLKTTLELEKGLKGLELEDANFMISDLLN